MCLSLTEIIEFDSKLLSNFFTCSYSIPENWSLTFHFRGNVMVYVSCFCTINNGKIEYLFQSPLMFLNGNTIFLSDTVIQGVAINYFSTKWVVVWIKAIPGGGGGVQMG